MRAVIINTVLDVWSHQIHLYLHGTVVLAHDKVLLHDPVLAAELSCVVPTIWGFLISPIKVPWTPESKEEEEPKIRGLGGQQRKMRNKDNGKTVRWYMSAFSQYPDWSSQLSRPAGYHTGSVKASASSCAIKLT